MCRQKTLEGTGKGNGKPEGWEVAGVAERDLSIVTERELGRVLGSSFLERQGERTRISQEPGWVPHTGVESLPLPLCGVLIKSLQFTCKTGAVRALPQRGKITQLRKSTWHSCGNNDRATLPSAIPTVTFPVRWNTEAVSRFSHPRINSLL